MFVFKDNEPVRLKNAKDADPETIGVALEQIAKKNGDQLQPRTVVDEARDPTNPLHKHFEWEDGVAAEAYRVQQARALIRIVLVADDTKPEAPPTRAFFAINDEKEGYSYRPVAQVVSSVEMRLSLLKSARRDLRAFRERYRSIKELCDPLEELFDLLDQAESSLSSSRPAA